MHAYLYVSLSKYTGHDNTDIYIYRLDMTHYMTYIMTYNMTYYQRTFLPPRMADTVAVYVIETTVGESVRDIEVVAAGIYTASGAVSRRRTEVVVVLFFCPICVSVERTPILRRF